MIAITESSENLPPSSSARDIEAVTRAAELVGCEVYHIPQDFTDCGDAEGALWHVPKQAREQPAVWIGYIPSLERYSAIYEASLAKGLESRSRGRVIVRKLAPLRYTRTSGEGFRLGREYRLFLYRDQVLGKGYYWEGEDSLKALNPEESRRVEELAMDASSRLKVPYVTVDIGQIEGGDWIVIEAGDAQFSGVSTIPLLPLWNKISSLRPCATKR